MPNSMTSINVLQQQIITRFGEFNFRKSARFCWSASQNEIQYQPARTVEDIWQLLHEIAHGLLQHHNYQKDIHLLQYEMAAWHTASEQIAPQFNIHIPTDFTEDQIESYRIWLHTRSTCPTCKHTGIQQAMNTYHCVNCQCSWLVNDARQKQLRRTKRLDQDHFG